MPKFIKINKTDFQVFNAMFNAPILDNENFENITKALQILSKKASGFHKKMVKRFQPQILPDPTGEEIYDWGEKNKDYQKAVERGFRFKPTFQEYQLLVCLRNYLLLELDLQKKGKHPTGFTPTSFIRISSFLANLGHKEEEPTRVTTPFPADTK